MLPGNQTPESPLQETGQTTISVVSQLTAQTTAQLIRDLTPEDLGKLTHFAELRLAHFGLATDPAQDIVQQAIYLVLKGAETDEGRRPRPADMENSETFQNYLRGIVNSIVEAGNRRSKHKAHPQSLNGLEEILASPNGYDHEFHDLKSQFFARLRQRAPERLLATIDEWEQNPDGKIPITASRKRSAAVRAIAQKVARELGMGKNQAACVR